jgi:hypothetical protein
MGISYFIIISVVSNNNIAHIKVLFKGEKFISVQVCSVLSSLNLVITMEDHKIILEWCA